MLSRNEKTKIEEELNSFENELLNLIDLSKIIIKGETKDILAFNNKYFELTKKIENIVSDTLKKDKKRDDPIWDRIDYANYDLENIYNSVSKIINDVLVKKAIEIEDQNKKKQALDLAVYSIVLSILAFILTNAGVLSVEGIAFKNVLLVNISFLLTTDVLFSLIYVFLGPAFYSKKGGLRIFVFIIAPIILITALVLISLFMK